MWFRSLLLTAVVVVGGVSCDNLTSVDTGAETEASVDVLLEKAQQLAKSELARLSAAEMIYRNRVCDHVYTSQDRGIRTDMVMKFYRNFRNAEVVDVKRTDSLLYPVEFVIRYDFDSLGTQGEAASYTNLAQAAKKVKNDNVFKVFASDSMVLTYECNALGECDTAIPEFLPRPNFWELNQIAVTYGILEIDDLSALADS